MKRELVIARWQYHGFCRLKFVFSFLFSGKPVFVASKAKVGKSFSDLPFDVYTYAIIKETTLVLIRE